MRHTAAILCLLVAPYLVAQQPQAAPAVDTGNRANLTIALDQLGDTDQGVVSRVTFRFTTPGDVPPDMPLIIQGSFMRGGEVVRNFRLPVPETQRSSVKTIQTFADGELIVEARLMIPLEEDAPVILGKASKAFPIAKTSKPYIADPDEGAEGVFAEGVVPETSGAVKIRTPRRAESLHRRRRRKAAGEARRILGRRKEDHVAQRSALPRRARPGETSEARRSARGRLRRQESLHRRRLVCSKRARDAARSEDQPGRDSRQHLTLQAEPAEPEKHRDQDRRAVRWSEEDLRMEPSAIRGRHPEFETGGSGVRSGIRSRRDELRGV